MDAPGHAGQLIAHEVLRDVLQVAVGHAFAVHGHQADRQARRVGLEHHRRKGPRRQILHVGDGQIRDGGGVDIRVGVGLKVDANDAHAVERSRLDMIDAAGEREEALQVIGDVAFDLLRRHPE
jgi:GTP cyclohydrolase III